MMVRPRRLSERKFLERAIHTIMMRPHSREISDSLRTEGHLTFGIWFAGNAIAMKLQWTNLMSMWSSAASPDGNVVRYVTVTVSAESRNICPEEFQTPNMTAIL